MNLAEYRADVIEKRRHPAHGKPFAKEELVRFRAAVDRIKLYPLE